tara:strand:- start:94 stop:393 length:300 start_codon:yes stop_codon:yes gene_type:complete
MKENTKINLMVDLEEILFVGNFKGIQEKVKANLSKVDMITLNFQRVKSIDSYCLLMFYMMKMEADESGKSIVFNNIQNNLIKSEFDRAGIESISAQRAA